jgi:uncharacterized protein with von Willebrand factor type A (vWA) domain
MDNSFERFTHFGNIADKDVRKKLASEIYEQIAKKTEKGIGFVNSDTDNFADAIKIILANETIKELCKQDKELAEKITQDILDFINKTKKLINKTDHPFEKEIEIKHIIEKSDKSDFKKNWDNAKLIIKDSYTKTQIDCDFYNNEFKECFSDLEWDLKKIEVKIQDIDEEDLLLKFFEKSESTAKDFYQKWRKIQPFFIKKYKRREIDCNEYFEKFKIALQENNSQDFIIIKNDFIVNWKNIKENKSKKNYDLINSAQEQNNIIKERLEKELIKAKSEKFTATKEHFTEKWDELLFRKKTKWELEIIEEQRKKFCEELYKQIEELKKLQEALEPFTNELGRLWDMSKGNWQKANLDILKRYAELLKKDKSLKDLAEMLGKMRQAEKEFEEEIFSNISLKHEWKAEHACKADLIGIRESDDLSSLLPSETALLSDETMQSVFFKKFAEKKLQTFEYQAKVLSFKEEEFQDKRQKEKEEAQGPFIICVDTSGSMHGTPETVAKTLCFAILKIAIRDNRKCYLISFSTGIETLNLTDLKNSLDKIIQFLSMSFSGGTDATPAMREAISMLSTADYKKADVIMLSDFVMSAFDKTTQEQIVKAKENKTKFHSLVVGNSKNPATIADFDNNWFYDTNNPNSILTLVKSISDL